MCSCFDELEAQRLRLQVSLDAKRSAKERNVLGQFATPALLAEDIARCCLSFYLGGEIRFLEPACGSGSFFSALLRSLGDRKVVDAIGVELDEQFASVANSLWSQHGLQITVGDFTKTETVPSFDASLLLANPPYVRHHHLSVDQKARLQLACIQGVGIKPSGLSGLYLYFILLSHRFLTPGAISAWLIPSEFMDVNYGKALKEYLTRKVTLKRIHRFDPSDVQFDDALITSAVVVFENTPPASELFVEFTIGGAVEKPRNMFTRPLSSLSLTAKWATYFRSGVAAENSGPVLKDYLQIRRGLATGSNGFFILPKVQADQIGIRPEHLKPILPSPRVFKNIVIERGAEGYPLLDKPLALIDCSVPLDDLACVDPALAKYLTSANEKITSGYLVRKRSPWYRQEQRPPAPFLCTYMGRGSGEKNPFRFMLNKSDATATNLFLMLYPMAALQAYINSHEEALELIHKALLSLTADDFRNGGRVYGGGLHKIEPRELGNLRADVIKDLLPDVLPLEESRFECRKTF